MEQDFSQTPANTSEPRSQRAALYVRVSTAARSKQGDAFAYDQNPFVQQKPLLELLAQRGWKHQRTYTDRVSGVRDRRAGPDARMVNRGPRALAGDRLHARETVAAYTAMEN